jgi:hypothetical protein
MQRLFLCKREFFDLKLGRMRVSKRKYYFTEQKIELWDKKMPRFFISKKYKM